MKRAKAPAITDAFQSPECNCQCFALASLRVRTADRDALKDAGGSVFIANEDEFLAAVEVTTANRVDLGHGKSGYLEHDFPPIGALSRPIESVEKARLRAKVK
jgi:hypothetical protein